MPYDIQATNANASKRAITRPVVTPVPDRATSPRQISTPMMAGFKQPTSMGSTAPTAA